MYDSCFVCPLSVYMDVVCDDNLSALTIKGNPSNELLEDTKFKLISEFSEMSNQSETETQIERMRNLYLHEIRIRGYELSLTLIIEKRYPEAIGFLNRNGLKCKTPETEEEFERLIKAVRMKITNNTAKYREAKTAYDSYVKKGEKPTRKYFNKLLVMLSVCEIIKFQLDPKKMTVAEFAEYLNLYNEYTNNLKSNQYGRKFRND